MHLGFLVGTMVQTKRKSVITNGCPFDEPSNAALKMPQSWHYRQEIHVVMITICHPNNNIEEH